MSAAPARTDMDSWLKMPGMGRPGTDDPTPKSPLARTGGGVADLLLVVGEGRMSTHAVPADVVIGRGEGCDLRIDHASLSRRHARVRRAGDQLTIQDLGSTNGTRVGGELRRGGEPVALGTGDSFHIGPFTFLVMSGDRGDALSVSSRDLLRIADPTLDGVPALVRDIAKSSASLLILGETGSGKEVLADTVHQLSGRGGMLVRINCAALSEALLESELFGHEKGAFTGAAGAKAGLLEAAQGGTVFLDEVGELPPGVQAKLLRAVEQREVLRLGAVKPVAIDVRFVAATNRDLLAEVDAGRFRRDLFFRLDGVTLMIPPLRERPHMIGALAMRFLDEACRRSGRKPARMGADVLAALEAHSWPGNVRELKAAIERAVLLARGADPTVRHLSFAREAAITVAPAPPVPSGVPDDLNAEQRADRDRVVAALEECVGNQTRAAKKLGISRTTLVTKLRLYRIPRPRS
jgi:two-component system response regulator AtoC